MSEKTDYDRAIEAYRFQVERYHTWMNYYSLFHGALLIAFYSLLKDVPKEQAWLPFVIASLGFLAGICWCYTVIGNKNWINNWMEVIRRTAELNRGGWLFRRRPVNIYNMLSATSRRLLSTQKVALIFTIIVTIGWGFVASMFSPFNICCTAAVLIIVTMLAVGLVFWGNQIIHSNTERMDRF